MRLILLVQLIVILFLVECQAARAPRPPPPPPPPYRCSKRDRNCVEWTQQSPPPNRIKFKKMSLSARNPLDYTKTTPSPTTAAPPLPTPSTKPPSLDLSALTVQQLIDLLNQKSAKESVTPPKLDRQIEPIQRPRIPNSLLPPPPHYDHRFKKPSSNNNEININQKIRSDIQVDSRDWNWDPEIYEPMHKLKGRKSQKSRSFERVRADDFDDFDDSDDDGSNFFFNDRESQRESRPQRVFQPPRPVASPPRVAQSGDFPAWPIPVDLIQMNYPPQIERGIFGGYNADICNQAAQKSESSANTKEQISKDSLFRPSLSTFFSDTIGKLGEESSKESSSNAKTSEKSDSGSIKSSDNQKSQLLNAFQKETSQGQVTSSSSSSSSESTSETSAAVQAAAEKLAELKEAFERAKQ